MPAGFAHSKRIFRRRIAPISADAPTLASLIHAWVVFVACLTDQAGVRAVADTYLPWAALSPVISVWGFLLDGVFIGATRTAELMKSMMVSLVVFVAVSLVLLATHGNHGLWAAMMIFMAVRGITLARYLPELVRGMDSAAATR